MIALQRKRLAYNKTVLLLASASPRRRELLSSLGVDYSCAAVEALDEAHLLSTNEGSWEERLAALAAAKGRTVSLQHPADLVLSADTEVILNGKALGKPKNIDAAIEMLHGLSGREHLVVTAVALQRSEPAALRSACTTTRVRVAPLTDETIRRYVEIATPFDFAGGYAIQGIGALLIEGIEGDYSNVVGLPLRLTAQLLAAEGISVL